MNKYILDANILFSGLLSKKEIYRKIFQENILYLPDFAMLEIAKYKKVILNKNKDIDEKDSVYVALSIEMNLPLITRDKELVTGLIEKNYFNIILFDEFIQKQYNL